MWLSQLRCEICAARLYEAAVLSSCLSCVLHVCVLESQNKLDLATYRQTESYIAPLLRQLKTKVGLGRWMDDLLVCGYM